MLFNCKIIEVPGTITKALVLTPTQGCSWAVVPPLQAVLSGCCSCRFDLLAKGAMCL